MRRLKSLGLWLVAAAIGLGSFVVAPQAAKAEVYIGLPRIGIYIGDGGRHYHRPAPRRYAYQHYGPPRYYRRAAPRRHWRRHHSRRHAPHWRSHRHGGWRGHGGRRGAYYR